MGTSVGPRWGAEDGHQSPARGVAPEFCPESAAPGSDIVKVAPLSAAEANMVPVALMFVLNRGL